MKNDLNRAVSTVWHISSQFKLPVDPVAEMIAKVMDLPLNDLSKALQAAAESELSKGEARLTPATEAKIERYLKGLDYVAQRIGPGYQMGEIMHDRKVMAALGSARGCGRYWSIVKAAPRAAWPGLLRNHFQKRSLKAEKRTGDKLGPKTWESIHEMLKLDPSASGLKLRRAAVRAALENREPTPPSERWFLRYRKRVTP